METKIRNEISPESLKGTKTEQNLHTALGGEAQAHLRYRWFAKKARADGYEAIARLFEETAGNEMEHAEIWFRYLGGYGATEHNLNTAAGGEHFEWETMYAQFADEARAEGFPALASLFERVAAVEKQHEQNYVTAMNEVRDGTVFTASDPETKWICLNCGYIFTGKEPPAFCPTCAHPRGYFDKKKS
ncbi:MAG: rubrerythrin family protein [Clostridia bacterium]|nr:rubrerythrin family protein [Clostridia bacterium]